MQGDHLAVAGGIGPELSQITIRQREPCRLDGILMTDNRDVLEAMCDRVFDRCNDPPRDLIERLGTTHGVTILEICLELTRKQVRY